MKIKLLQSIQVNGSFRTRGSEVTVDEVTGERLVSEQAASVVKLAKKKATAKKVAKKVAKTIAEQLEE